MKVAVFGLGYVGAVTSACLAKVGHDVVGIDIDEGKVSMIQNGRSPIVEPGLDDVVAKAHAEGKLSGRASAQDVLADCDLSLVCVGTPSKSNGDLDLKYVIRVAEQIGEYLQGADRYHCVVFRSTMLPGTTLGQLRAILERSSGKAVGEQIGLAMCPEFLRETTGIRDFYEPPFIVAGITDSRSEALLRELFSFSTAPFHAVTISTAETLKYVCNTFHAVKVTFANEIGRVCREAGADAREVMRIFCEDDQLNLSSYYLKPAFAFGGSCLPKDVRALLYRARTLDVELPMLSSVLPSNQVHIRRAVWDVLDSGSRNVALMGLSFKSGTDDLRESPYVELAETLIGKGVNLRIYDANVNPDSLFGSNLRYVAQHLPHLNKLLTGDPAIALQGAEFSIISTAEPRVSKALLNTTPNQILDLTGKLGPEIEALPGYIGVAW